MSGGSYDYLCYADATELFNKRQSISDMVTALAGLGHLDAARETESIKLILNQFEVQIDAPLRRLQDVWKAVEWTESGDTGPEAVDIAIAKYRGALSVPSQDVGGARES